MVAVFVTVARLMLESALMPSAQKCESESYATWNEASRVIATAVDVVVIDFDA